MNLNAIVLVSSVLNFQTLRFDDGNDLPYALFLPTYTATAWFHKKLAPELLADRRKTLEEAEKFAMGEYTLALMKGSGLSAQSARTLHANWRALPDYPRNTFATLTCASRFIVLPRSYCAARTKSWDATTVALSAAMATPRPIHPASIPVTPPCKDHTRPCCKNTWLKTSIMSANCRIAF